MLIFTKGQTNTAVLTLTEKQLISAPNYLFVFTGRSTQTDVKVVKLNAADSSLYKTRYNKFTFDASVFNTRKLEQFIYNVYEQTSTTNTDPTGLNLLETGLMDLRQAVNPFTIPNEATTFIIP
jgi:hypothetical protein